MIKSKKKAMTLIELILVMGILVVIMGATSTFFISNYRNLNNAEDTADLQNSAQSVINELSQATLNSTSYNNPITNKFVFSNDTFKLENNEFKNDEGVIISNIKSIVINPIENNTGIFVKVTAGLGSKTETIETQLYFRKELVYSGSNSGNNSGGDSGDTNEGGLSNIIYFYKKLDFKGSKFDASNNTFLIDDNYKLYGNQQFFGNLYINGNFNISGSSKSNGEVFIDGNLKLSGSTILNGNAHVKGNVELSGSSQINGETYIDGNLKLSGTAKVKGNTQTKGNIELNNSSCIDGNVEHDGNIKKRGTSIIEGTISKNSGIKVEYEEPEIEIALKSDSWYEQKGYLEPNEVTVNNFVNGTKIFAKGNYRSPTWNDSTFINGSKGIIIVSEGDIDLTNNYWKKITGVFIAPNGKVQYNGPSLEGVVISEDGFYVTSGSTLVKLNDISDYFASNADFPIKKN
ncbi:hypothetical protein SH2C18_21450 [Clostridium sediminicola]|uniref:polymer-forming cytoskeletal protein n=1 Tax=Clostridium sediminicola TaxID=3114879 RepID=UPI0031F21D08